MHWGPLLILAAGVFLGGVYMQRLSSHIRALIRGAERRIMAQLDDLSAAQAAEAKKLTVVEQGVTKVSQEVADLIALLQAHPAAPDLGPAIAAAQSVGARLDAVGAALAAVPPEPTV